MAIANATVLEARLGGSVLWLTVGAGVLLAGTMIALLAGFGNVPGPRWLWTALPGLVLLLGWAWRPTGYLVDGGSIHVLRPIGRKCIASVPAEAEPVPSRFLWGALRLFGNGGLFGVTGWFRKRELGVFRAWVTDTSKLVLLRSAGKVIVISPRDREQFINLLGAAHPASSTGATAMRGDGPKAAQR